MRTKKIGERVERRCSLCALFSRVACVLCMGNDDAVTHLCRRQIQQQKIMGTSFCALNSMCTAKRRGFCSPALLYSRTAVAYNDMFKFRAIYGACIHVEISWIQIAILCGNFGKFTTVSVHRSEAINILREKEWKKGWKPQYIQLPLMPFHFSALFLYCLH